MHVYPCAYAHKTWRCVYVMCICIPLDCITHEACSFTNQKQKEKKTSNFIGYNWVNGYRHIETKTKISQKMKGFAISLWLYPQWLKYVYKF